MAWVEDFSWKVVYVKWDYIVLKWVNSFYSYWDLDNCPVEKDRFWNCVWEESKTGEWVMNILKEDCYRPNNYDDMIRNSY